MTGRTQFQSSEAGIVAVDPAGLVKAGPIPGEATIMARYMNVIAICHVAIPLPGSVPTSCTPACRGRTSSTSTCGRSCSRWASRRRRRRTTRSSCGACISTSSAGCRRRTKCGRFSPTAIRQKRARIVDELLQRPEYADHWAAKWADLLRPNPYRVGIKAVLNYDAWIRDSFRQNKPYDQFVRELVTAQG